METTMKRLIGALAAATLLVLPMNAMAQSHGGMGGHGSFAGHGGFGGGGWRGGGFRGGGFRGYGYPFWGGLALGLDLGYPWYYWGDPYWYWDGPYADWYGYYPYDYGPPPATTTPPTACGAWVWHGDQNRYQWVPSPCAPAAPPAS